MTNSKNPQQNKKSLYPPEVSDTHSHTHSNTFAHAHAHIHTQLLTS